MDPSLLQAARSRTSGNSGIAPPRASPQPGPVTSSGNAGYDIAAMQTVINRQSQLIAQLGAAVKTALATAATARQETAALQSNFQTLANGFQQLSGQTSAAVAKQNSAVADALDTIRANLQGNTGAQTYSPRFPGAASQGVQAAIPPMQDPQSQDDSLGPDDSDGNQDPPYVDDGLDDLRQYGSNGDDDEF